MDLLFNKEVATVPQGQIETKALLGFIDANIKFDNLITDIELRTPYFIKYIGQETYDFIAAYYENDTVPATPVTTTEQQDAMPEILKKAQLSILFVAYKQFAQSNDLEHTNAGRKMNKTEDQSTPWEWQVDRDNAMLMKKAYQAMDQLINLLDTHAMPTWVASKTYTRARSLFVYNTDVFDDIHSINDSGQLYYRMVPFMETHQKQHVLSILGKTQYDAYITSIKARTEDALSETDQVKITLSRRIIVYRTLMQAYKTMPVEMFPYKVNYRENTTMKSKARAEVVQNFEKEAMTAMQDLTNIIQSTETTPAIRDPYFGTSDPEKKFANL